MGEWILARRPVTKDAVSQLSVLLGDVIGKTSGRMTMQQIIDDHNEYMSDILITMDDAGKLRSAVVMRVMTLANEDRILDIEIAAGHLDDFKEKLEALGETYAKNSNCSRIQIEGRPGWMRVLGPGWREYSRTIEKEIHYG